MAAAVGEDEAVAPVGLGRDDVADDGQADVVAGEVPVAGLDDGAAAAEVGDLEALDRRRRGRGPGGGQLDVQPDGGRAGVGPVEVDDRLAGIARLRRRRRGRSAW